ncbi:hypothetical protein CMI37_26055 [Candidatus Pacearchaeota archaeon]|nr:hypothetical protein [Candidatus Pacearchaeota archaeon]|tara:strand:+ start:537 stop:794 length:258 start_codon:yes stop_codon:yes gene_type:complete
MQYQKNQLPRYQLEKLNLEDLNIEITAYQTLIDNHENYIENEGHSNYIAARINKLYSKLAEYMIAKELKNETIAKNIIKNNKFKI